MNMALDLFKRQQRLRAQEGYAAVPEELPTPPGGQELSWYGRGLKSLADQVREGVLPDEALAEIRQNPASLGSLAAYVSAAMALSGGKGGKGAKWSAIKGPGEPLGMGNRQEFIQTPKGRYQLHALAGENRGKYAVNLVKAEGEPEHVGIFRNITEAKRATDEHLNR